MPRVDPPSAQPDQLEASGATRAAALASLHRQARGGRYVFTSDPIEVPDAGVTGVLMRVEVSTAARLATRRPIGGA